MSDPNPRPPPIELNGGFPWILFGIIAAGIAVVIFSYLAAHLLLAFGVFAAAVALIAMAFGARTGRSVTLRVDGSGIRVSATVDDREFVDFVSWPEVVAVGITERHGGSVAIPQTEGTRAYAWAVRRADPESSGVIMVLSVLRLFAPRRRAIIRAIGTHAPEHVDLSRLRQ